MSPNYLLTSLTLRSRHKI